MKFRRLQFNPQHAEWWVFPHMAIIVSSTNYIIQILYSHLCIEHITWVYLKALSFLSSGFTALAKSCWHPNNTKWGLTYLQAASHNNNHSLQSEIHQLNSAETFQPLCITWTIHIFVRWGWVRVGIDWHVDLTLKGLGEVPGRWDSKLGLRSGGSYVEALPHSSSKLIEFLHSVFLLYQLGLLIYKALKKDLRGLHK